jgi:small membrane protein
LTGIQLILLSGFAFLALYFFTKLRSRIADAVIFLLFFGFGIVFVIFPEWTNLLANKLGVGRGADLIFYTSIIGFSFVVMMLYSKVRKLEQTITQIIRNKAKETATSSKDN